MYFERNRACVVGTEVRKFYKYDSHFKIKHICTIKAKAFFSFYFHDILMLCIRRPIKIKIWKRETTMILKTKINIYIHKYLVHSRRAFIFFLINYIVGRGFVPHFFIYRFIFHFSFICTNLVLTGRLIHFDCFIFMAQIAII